MDKRYIYDETDAPGITIYRKGGQEAQPVNGAQVETGDDGPQLNDNDEPQRPRKRV